MPEINPVSQFGARPDGLADSTDAIRKALAARASAGGDVRFPRGTYLISDQIELGGNPGSVFGEPGTTIIVQTAASKRAGFLVRKHQPGIRISNFNVDCRIVKESYSEAPFYSIDSHDVVFSDLTITGTQWGCKGISVRATKEGGGFANVSVLRVTVEGPEPRQEPHSAGILFDVPVNMEDVPGTAPLDFWRKKHRAARPIVECPGVVIQDCHVTGGYYGIGISGLTGHIVQNNTCRNNMRGMSLQNCSSYGYIGYNNVHDCVSAGIHLAYGSSFNNIEGNTVTSSVAEGEGLVQAYVGSTNNTFENNTLLSTGPIGAKFYAYCAVNSDGNMFIDNYLEGTCSRAYFGAESDWSNTIRDPAHRGLNQTSNANDMASEPLRNVAFVRNGVVPLSPNAPIFVLTALRGLNLDNIGIIKNNVSRFTNIVHKIESNALVTNLIHV